MQHSLTHTHSALIHRIVASELWIISSFHLHYCIFSNKITLTMWGLSPILRLILGNFLSPLSLCLNFSILLCLIIVRIIIKTNRIELIMHHMLLLCPVPWLLSFLPNKLTFRPPCANCQSNVTEFECKFYSYL